MEEQNARVKKYWMESATLYEERKQKLVTGDIGAMWMKKKTAMMHKMDGLLLHVTMVEQRWTHIFTIHNY